MAIHYHHIFNIIMEKITILANRLAESILMDWDKEEQIKLAKEVACECHKIFNEKESREFVSLIKRMREAQKEFESDSPHVDYNKIMEVYRDKFHLESEVDEYLKKIEG